jgi:hypothetical protein
MNLLMWRGVNTAAFISQMGREIAAVCNVDCAEGCWDTKPVNVSAGKRAVSGVTEWNSGEECRAGNCGMEWNCAAQTQSRCRSEQVTKTEGSKGNNYR